jgi:hypothetical protein
MIHSRSESRILTKLLTRSLFHWECSIVYHIVPIKCSGRRGGGLYLLHNQRQAKSSEQVKYCARQYYDNDNSWRKPVDFGLMLRDLNESHANKLPGWQPKTPNNQRKCRSEHQHAAKRFFGSLSVAQSPDGHQPPSRRDSANLIHPLVHLCHMSHPRLSELSAHHNRLRQLNFAR